MRLGERIALRKKREAAGLAMVARRFPEVPEPLRMLVWRVYAAIGADWSLSVKDGELHAFRRTADGGDWEMERALRKLSRLPWTLADTVSFSIEEERRDEEADDEPEAGLDPYPAHILTIRIPFTISST